MYATGEYAEQVALMEWCAWQANRDARYGLLFAIPNGELRDVVVAGRLKRSGVRSGVPDLCLPVASGIWHGLFIEMKRRDGGRVAPEQVHWLSALNAQGYLGVVCHGFDEARLILSFYLGE